ncbi:acyl-CoA synthetase [Marinobacterium nitratireducens]|uniref:Acyl-CoA synthetase n=1 Tax=Marinobacterium nitratireducens TaxID=518897 RepID=A0A917ZQ65_9GAMM|nr:AMP-binding protein [Marinobacterium nitratireducens]GGO88472.1 acyl-CoA synthetase [Marinobacterium nitratireducens]
MMATGPDADIRAQLLQLVDQLCTELRSQGLDRPVELDSRLEQDLGLDSLSRAELFSRIEQRFGAALPGQTFAEAETPRDLLRALQNASPVAVPPQAAPVTADNGDSVAGLPRHAGTLVEALAWHVEHHPQRTHIHFHRDADDGEQLSYGGLWREACALTAGLQRKGVEAGQKVALMLPTGRDYFISFVAIWLAGATPVPLYPPLGRRQLEDQLQRQAGILDNCQARLLIAPAAAQPLEPLLKARVGGLQALVQPADLAADADQARILPCAPGDIALLQYTSGSTGNPKGVVLSHANLLANIRAAGQALRVDSRDVFVSWLPLYHDMGLIGAWFGSLYHAVRLVSLPPQDFLARPARWLEALHRHRGTLSAAPNFAYELCLQRVPEPLLEGLDLSAWRLALNGAEAVNPATLEAFSRRFERCGLQRTTVFPVYGLAECSVALAFPEPGLEAVIDRVQRAPLMREGIAEPATARDSDTLEFACCGRAIPGHRIRICDDSGRELPQRRQGRIQFRGPSATSGYYRNSEATARLFEGDWLETGDLGYLTANGLHITGRSKDLIIRAGRNLYPEELERAVGEVPGLRRGRVAAFGIDDAGTERLILMAESRTRDERLQEQQRRDAAAAVSALIGEPPDEVVLVPAGILLKTSSGKIRRNDCRERYRRGDYRIRPPWRQKMRLLLTTLKPAGRRLSRRLGQHLFAGWALVTGIPLALIAALALLGLPSVRSRWRALHRITRLWARLTRTPIRVRGLDNLGGGGACVCVANHSSYLDAFVLLAALPEPLAFVAKAELQEAKLLRPLLDRLGIRYVNRRDPEQGLLDARDASEHLKQGARMLFFPEGTFEDSAGLLPFHTGAFVCAAESGTPVVPIAIRGTRPILRGDSWYAYHGALDLVIGAPISGDPGKATWEQALALRDRARAHILRHCGEPDLAGSSGSLEST